MGLFEREGPPVPVTILGGFLGAGKTTLLNHLVRTSGLHLGVLVNDFGEIDLDARLLAESADGVVSLANGCVCCTIKGDVGRALMRLLERPERPEHVVLETSGISNPGAVVESFVELARTGLVRLDGVVSVVDGANWLGLERPRGSLAWCQVVAADLVVLSKVDLVEPAVVAEVEREVAALAPGARVVRAARGEVPAQVLLSGAARIPSGGHTCDEHCAEGHAHGGATPHGFRSFSVSAPRALRWKELVGVLKGLPAAIHRVKGLVCLEERPGDLLEVHVVGKRLDVRTIGPADSVRSDMVLIGADGGFDPQAVEASIRACFVG